MKTGLPKSDAIRVRNKKVCIAGRSAGRSRRPGAAVVEMAVTLPIMILIVMGCLEVGRSVMVKHVLEEAARAGCRIAVAETSTTQDVTSIVDKAMQNAQLSGYTVDIEPANIQDLGPFEAVTVTVSIPYSQVSWVNFGYMSGRTVSGSCVMPAECEGDELPDKSGKRNKKNKKNKKNKTKK